MLEARADSFKQWLADYKTAADSNRAKFAGYNAVSSGATGLRSYWRQDIADERNRAARVLYSAYGDLSAALGTARTRYIADTTRTVDLASTENLDDRAVLLTAASLSGCVAHYDNEITRLKTFSPQPSGAWEPSADAISGQNEYVIRSGTVWYALAHRGICN